MYRTALRSGLRPAGSSGLRTSAVRAAPRRFASTASPADKPRSWKGSAARWALAAGTIYYYNTSSVFAEELPAQTVPAPASFAADELPTVESIVEEKRRQIKEKLEKQRPETTAPAPAAPKKTDASPQGDSTAAGMTAASPAALEEEAGQQGAFNPETGEINWDCPCLGGMADGPCGEEFKAAFSCFVYSEAEPKGMDCIEKFQGMQTCFKKYPEIYGGELTDDDDEAADLDIPAAAPAAASSSIPEDHQMLKEEHHQTPPAKAASDALPPPKPVQPSEIPQKWDDATAANNEVEKEDKKDEEKKE